MRIWLPSYIYTQDSTGELFPALEWQQNSYIRKRIGEAGWQDESCLAYLYFFQIHVSWH
jgi:hypothetical protein